MKSNELFEQIHSGEIKEDTEIDVINELTGQYITTIEYRNGMLNWEPGEFDTSFLCNIDIDFVVKEKKEIKHLPIPATANDIYNKIEELIDKINELTKEREEK